MPVSVAVADVAPFTAEAVRRARVRRGWSGRRAAAAAGLSEAAVSKIESGAHRLTLRSFARLAMSLEMSPMEVWTVVAHEGRR